jgi:hypothetical protein
LARIITFRCRHGSHHAPDSPPHFPQTNSNSGVHAQHLSSNRSHLASPRNADYPSAWLKPF